MRFWLSLFCFAVALNILVGLPEWPGVLAGQLNDPDSYMRLVRIYDGVRAGHLTNLVAGVVIEWSRLMDAGLWGLAAPLAVFVAWKPAIFAAGVVSGPLIAGAFAVALAFVADPFVARRFLWILPPAVAVLPALANYAAPGVVTHHVLLLVLIALTAGCVARADLRETGWNFLAGVCGGFAVWLTPETMPFVLFCFGLSFVRWLERPVGVGLAACGAGFVDVLGFGFAIDPPVGGYGVLETDRLSIVFVALGLAVFLAGVLAWRLEGVEDRRLRRAAGFFGAVLLLGGWLAAFPAVAAGPYGLLSATDTKLFFGVIGEMQPAGPTPTSFADLWPGVLGVAIAAGICVGRRDFGWWYGLAGLVLAFGLGVKFLRFAPVSSAAGAVLVVLALQKLSARWAERPSRAALARVCLVALLFVVPFLPAWADRGAAGQTSGAVCDVQAFAPALAAAAGKTVLADVNDSPELLWRSDTVPVGALYYHGAAGFLRLRAAWRAPGAGASEPAAVRASGAQFVLACPKAGRTLLVADLPKTTLWDAVVSGAPPSWLHLVATGPGGFVLYKIAPGG
jgi:hypothetical protein